MTSATVEKRAYYETRGMSARLAERYYRLLGDADAILDVGCGTGDLGRHRPGPHVEVHGVDVDELAVSLAAEFETTARVDLDEEPLPYDDESFDAILARDVLEHLHHPGRLARELRRVLRPGGVLVASVVVARPAKVWADYTHVRGFTRASARALFEDAGFRVDAVWPMGPLPLAQRLGALDLVPHLLRIPGVGRAWTSSWELKARAL